MIVLFFTAFHHRLYPLYSLVPMSLFNLFWSVYLVRRFGGTPGKLCVGLRIRKVNGEPVGYREALLRDSPALLLWLLMSIATIQAAGRMTDQEYAAKDRHQRLAALRPAWAKPVDIGQSVWTWSELLVLLTNRKRRALHDFLAGTVVVFATSLPAAKPEARSEEFPSFTSTA